MNLKHTIFSRQYRRFLLKKYKRLNRWNYHTIKNSTTRVSGAVLYGILSAIAVKLFFQPGHIYSAGATGIAQIIATLSGHWVKGGVPVGIVLYAINVPVLIVAWFYIGRKFTLFTLLTVTVSTLFMGVIPETQITKDPVMNAIFGGLCMGVGAGMTFKNGISSGGIDIISLLVRKKTGRNVGSISLMINIVIMSLAGFLFGWEYALYSMITIFVGSQMTDSVFSKQQKMQAMIITSQPDRIIYKIQSKLKHGVTIINEAEGAYLHDKKTVLLTIISRSEYYEFKSLMKKTDPHAFISVSDNVKIIGNFSEKEEG